MTPKFRQILYVIGVVAFAGLTLLSTFHILDPNVAASVSAALTTVLGLFGVTISGVAGYNVTKQVRNGTITPNTPAAPADQAISGLDAVIAQAQHAQAEVERVKNAIGEAVQNVPILGPLATQALNTLPKI
jgi:hypothetical protein